MRQTPLTTAPRRQLFMFVVKLVNFSFSVYIATGYIHSGEMNIFIATVGAI